MTVLTLSPEDDCADLVRGVTGTSVVVVIAPERGPLALALAKAAIAPLAIERAPETRVNAVLAGEGADIADVLAAIAFLESACSTTGQLLEIV